MGGDYKPISTQIMSADFDTPIFSIFRHNIGFGMYSNWVNTENAFRFEIDNDNKAITNEKNKNGINLSTTNYLLQNTNLQDKVGYFTEVYNKKFIARMFDDNLLYLYKIDGDEIPTLPISTFDNKQ
ncbi:MAG: hypothetical protein LBG59_09010 [Candidatus Peribacteria bacterium]|nr:hypothetical protein [Candidatus Peribacteria bacterium]